MGKLNSMENAEELALADSLETSILDSFSASRSTSVVDQTLDEIRSLRLIDEELAKMKKEGPKDSID
jgi:hypothetical protein